MSTGRAAGGALAGRESLAGGVGAGHVEGSGGLSVELILGNYVGHNLRFGWAHLTSCEWMLKIISDGAYLPSR